jgi:aspartate carbamoyltransferase catalytic subunit
MNNLISIRDLDKAKILEIIEKADHIKSESAMKGKLMGSLFFEPSTRTRLSFEAAMKRLGGEVIGFADIETTSLKKGESLKDTIKMIENYADFIVIRHPEIGSARIASEHAQIPVINAGDGAGEHPTQTLIDLYSIKKTQGKLDGLKICLAGDLKFSRAMHSLALALSLFNSHIYFVSPNKLSMPNTILGQFEKDNYTEAESYDDIISDLDILYTNRIQEERFESKKDFQKYKDAYILKASMLKNAKNNLKVLNPLPRINEINPDVDETKFAYYFDQAAHGIPVRKAVIMEIMK